MTYDTWKATDPRDAEYDPRDDAALDYEPEEEPESVLPSRYRWMALVAQRINDGDDNVSYHNAHVLIAYKSIVWC